MAAEPTSAKVNQPPATFPAHRRWMGELRKWLRPGIGVKRWLLLLALGILGVDIAFTHLALVATNSPLPTGLVGLLMLAFLPPVISIPAGLTGGLTLIVIALIELNRSILAPFRSLRRGSLIDLKTSDMQQGRGLRLVALGGGTGLPSVLRGFKRHTGNITAIVTVADDGGSSGKLREELGVLPPGDLRQNIAALANDEALITQLFQYRFGKGGLEGHSFGNLFLTALTAITGSMDRAVMEAGRVLAIQGRVLPATLQDVKLGAELRDPQSGALRRVIGESEIPEVGGQIERVFLLPESVRAFPESIRAILAAELVVIGPGSLFTSILPTLLVNGIPEAIRASNALCVYVCNIAMQQGETNGYTVADHVLAIERHIGRGVIDTVLANNATPVDTIGRTRYVLPCPEDHEIRTRYDVVETDLTDPARPWRHSSEKLVSAVQRIMAERWVRLGDT